ncbi:MAG TPA: hypothetical protein VFU46_10040 [Gemmatimonadales bacterium]|nr:hypothetical protein [Gemmatimonadales bacterium]
MRPVVLAIAALLATTPLAGQTPGARIRLATADGPTRIGRLVALDADSVRVVDSAGTELAYARADLRRLETYVGRRSSLGRGAARGAMIGGGVGLLIGILASTEEPTFVCEGGGCIAAGTAAGALWGVVIGGVIGAATKHDQWERLNAAPMQPEVRPIAHGTSVGLTVRF